MTRDDDTVGRAAKAAVSFVVGRVAKENAKSGPGGEFVAGCGGQVRVTGAPEDAWQFPMKCKVRCRKLKRLCREDVEEVCGSREGLSLVGWRHDSLEQQGADNIVSGSNDAPSFTVLGGCVGT